MQILVSSSFFLLNNSNKNLRPVIIDNVQIFPNIVKLTLFKKSFVHKKLKPKYLFKVSNYFLLEIAKHF